MKKFIYIKLNTKESSIKTSDYVIGHPSVFSIAQFLHAILNRKTNFIENDIDINNTKNFPANIIVKLNNINPYGIFKGQEYFSSVYNSHLKNLGIEETGIFSNAIADIELEMFFEVNNNHDIFEEYNEDIENHIIYNIERSKFLKGFIEDYEVQIFSFEEENDYINKINDDFGFFYKKINEPFNLENAIINNNLTLLGYSFLNKVKLEELKEDKFYFVEPVLGQIEFDKNYPNSNKITKENIKNYQFNLQNLYDEHLVYLN